MPVPRYDAAPVDRPSGLIPPPVDLSGVTELRLHGVGGTTAEDLLGDLAPQQVSGDRIAGFYRTADLPTRHVEAYSWGGLTSRSGSRVLWLLLLPFAMANLAGWMCTPKTHGSGWRFRLHRTFVRWASLGITVNVVLIMAMGTMELLAYQCGGRDDCAGDNWLLSWLRSPLLAEYAGRRVLIGALVPVLFVAFLAVLTVRSINRYEEVDPPYQVGHKPPRAATSAAQPKLTLADRTFWDGRRSAFDLGCAHIAAALAFIALALGYTGHGMFYAGDLPPMETRWALLATIGLGGAAVLGALVVTALDECRRWAAGLLIALAVGALLAAAVFLLAQPEMGKPWGYLPNMRWTINFAFGGIFGALGLTLVSTLLGGWKRGIFFIFGPFVVLAVSIALLNAVMLGAMLRITDLFGEVNSLSLVPVFPAEPGELYVYPIITTLHQYLTLVPLALIVLFGLFELVAYWRAGASRKARATAEKYYAVDRYPQPDGEPDWYDNAAGQRRWIASVVRARVVAKMPRHIDRLLTAMAVVGVVLLIAIQIRYWVFHQLPWGTQWTVTAGSYLTAALPLLVVLLLRRGWTNLASRRRIGVIWDVCTFWPRAFHPLAPPSYAERAVPEVQRRLWRLHSNGGKAVVAAHSQGSVIAAAALLQRDNLPTDGQYALVTFGSPLRTLYGWAFPAYFTDSVLRSLEPRLLAWRNFHYDTDYIGGAALAAQPASTVDVLLPDPETCWYIYGQPLPLARRHTGYWDDPAVWREVDELAAALAAGPRVPVQPGPPVTETEVGI
ncbi:hypothetical protein ACFQO7_00280 [Catellatospora aurea]|uniref:Integral membrane protein n=1 Tax=Catellatospora aurea TaxID=1337874 RepID=A0ABW2GLH1_9ACTN